MINKSLFYFLILFIILFSSFNYASSEENISIKAKVSISYYYFYETYLISNPPLETPFLTNYYNYCSPENIMYFSNINLENIHNDSDKLDKFYSILENEFNNAPIDNINIKYAKEEGIIYFYYTKDNNIYYTYDGFFLVGVYNNQYAEMNNSFEIANIYNNSEYSGQPIYSKYRTPGEDIIRRGYKIDDNIENLVSNSLNIFLIKDSNIKFKSKDKINLVHQPHVILTLITSNEYKITNGNNIIEEDEFLTLLRKNYCQDCVIEDGKNVLAITSKKDSTKLFFYGGYKGDKTIELPTYYDIIRLGNFWIMDRRFHEIASLLNSIYMEQGNIEKTSFGLLPIEFFFTNNTLIKEYKYLSQIQNYLFALEVYYTKYYDSLIFKENDVYLSLYKTNKYSLEVYRFQLENLFNQNVLLRNLYVYKVQSILAIIAIFLAILALLPHPVKNRLNNLLNRPLFYIWLIWIRRKNK